jgi:diaminopimelate decarboxylase
MIDPALADAAIRAARRWGTPLYLYDLPRLRADAAVVRAAFPDPWLRLYSLKANGLPALVREVADAGGFGASAVSAGELSLAARAGVPVADTALEGIARGRPSCARPWRGREPGRHCCG